MPIDTKKRSPFGLKEWLYFLKNKKLPVKNSNLTRLKAYYNKEKGSLASIQEALFSDPLLAFAIINQANKCKNKSNSEIKNPMHAAAMLGSNNMRKMLSHFIPIDIDTSPKPHLAAFLNEVEASFEAASLARNWTVKKLPDHEESIFWVTLFKDSIRWLLCFYAHPVMKNVNGKIAKGETPSQAEMSVLGCHIEELTVHIFTQWGTSSQLIEPFSNKNMPSKKDVQSLAKLAPITDQLPELIQDKKLIILVNSPLIYCYFASKVIREAKRIGWDSKQLMFFYRVIATITHLHVSNIIECAHSSCVETAKKNNLGGTSSLAKQLLQPNLYKGITYQKTASLSPIAKLKKSLGKNNQYETKYKANLALKTIKQTIPHATHCIIFKHSKNRILPLLQSGYDKVKMKKIKWNNPPSNIFIKLSTKQSATHLFGQKLIQLTKKLPQQSSDLLGKNSHLILSSVQTSETDMTIFWLETHDEFSETDFKTLKQIVSITRHNNT